MYVITEDPLGEDILKKIFLYLGIDYSSFFFICKGGVGNILKEMKTYIRISHSLPVVVLIDLDKKECAPSFVSDLLSLHSSVPDRFILRIAVRESESWVLADGENCAEFFGIPRERLTNECDELDDPKLFFMNLINRHSRVALRNSLVRFSGKLRQSEEYNSILGNYISCCWNVEIAMLNSPSLKRAVKRIEDLYKIES